MNGMVYLRMRWYSTEFGHLMSRDPIKFKADTANYYRFVMNRPHEMVDPTGQDGGFLSKETVDKVLSFIESKLITSGTNLAGPYSAQVCAANYSQCVGNIDQAEDYDIAEEVCKSNLATCLGPQIKLPEPKPRCGK